jgi:hypothetical protein
MFSPCSVWRTPGMSKRQRVECFRARCGLGRFPGVEPGFLGISSLVSIEIVSHGGHGGHGGSFWVERLDAEERELASAFFAGCSFLSKPSLSPPRFGQCRPIKQLPKTSVPSVSSVRCPLFRYPPWSTDIGVAVPPPQLSPGISSVRSYRTLRDDSFGGRFPGTSCQAVPRHFVPGSP